MGGYEHLHADNVKHDLRGNNVLVTGGTQGIGSGSSLPNSKYLIQTLILSRHSLRRARRKCNHRWPK
jgi:hypothetical protein